MLHRWRRARETERGATMEENTRVPESERLQMAQILELDMEELQVEEVDDDDFEASDNGGGDDDHDAFLRSGNGDRAAGPSYGFTFDTSLASLHTYLGEIDDIHGRNSFFDGGTILKVPMLYFEGVVLFPEATLPLRIVDSKFIAAVEKALNQVDAPCTIGVLHHVDGLSQSEIRRHLETRENCHKELIPLIGIWKNMRSGLFLELSR